jgi:gluconate 5-dehydrogenase
MTSNLFNLSGQRILITGSNGGIGLEIARGLAQHGASVILNGRDPEKLEAAAERLRDTGLEVETSRFDVTNELEVNIAIAELEVKGAIAGLVNNAGIQRRVRLESVTLEVWNEVLLTNLTSAMLVSRAVAPGMIAREHGKIVNICSLMSDLGRTTTGPYTAAKGGLKMLTRAIFRHRNDGTLGERRGVQFMGLRQNTRRSLGQPRGIDRRGGVLVLERIEFCQWSNHLC